MIKSNFFNIKSNYIRYKYVVRIGIEIVATIDRTAEIGSKMSIKSRFKYDLDRILAGPRLDRISLLHSLFAYISTCFFFQFTQILWLFRGFGIFGSHSVHASIPNTLELFKLAPLLPDSQTL